MKQPLHDAIMADLGLRAFAAHYYNTSEPLLNKRLPDDIAFANRYQVRTSVSSHLSLPKLDAERIVESGLDILQVAADGATQAVYERYRRGGQIELVYENISRIVAAKKRLKRSTPTIRWHYLTFEHNAHEVDLAIEKARALGVNDFFIVSPVDVSDDDPSIVVHYHPRQWQTVEIEKASHAVFEQSLDPLAPAIEEALDEDLVSKAVTAGDSALAAGDGSDRCDWLYVGAYLNAYGDVFPCNIGDLKHAPGDLIFGSVKGRKFDYNSAAFMKARVAMNESRRAANGEQVRCEDCGGRPTPQIGLRAALPALQGLAQTQSWITPDLQVSLSNWSRHQVVPPGEPEPPNHMRC